MYVRTYIDKVKLCLHSAEFSVDISMSTNTLAKFRLIIYISTDTRANSNAANTILTNKEDTEVVHIAEINGCRKVKLHYIIPTGNHFARFHAQ